MSDKQKQLAFLKCEKALYSLSVIIDKPVDKDRAIIDATIQRFEFCIELFWKLLKRILQEQGLDPKFPKEILQEAFKGELIHEEVLWLNMLKDRNLTSHTYDEELANEVFTRIKGYFPTLQETFISLDINYRK